MTAHRIARLGADRASSVLRGTGLLRRLAETEFFADKATTVNRNAALSALFGGSSKVPLSTINIPQVPLLGGAAASIPAPFTFLKVDWLGDGSDVTYYSELDRANSRHNLLGKILKVGDAARAYGTNRNIQRVNGVSLTLEDFDRAIATRVRAQVAVNGGLTGKYNLARFYFSVGSAEVTEDYYVPTACPFKVERVTITETSVEFSLIDASDDVLLASVEPPKIVALLNKTVPAWPSAGTQAVMNATNGVTWDLKRLDALPNQDFPGMNGVPQLGDIPAVHVDANLSQSAVVTIPFGGWTKAPFAWGSFAPKFADGTAGKTRENPRGVVVLGASKRPDWMLPHFWGDCQNAPASKVRNEPIVWIDPTSSGKSLYQLIGYGGSEIWQPNGSTGIGAYIDVHTVQIDSANRGIASGGETWYVAVLYVYNNGSAGQTGDSNFRARAAMRMLSMANANGRVFIDWSGVSASVGWQSGDKVTAAQVIGYLAQYHSFSLGPDFNLHERGVSAIRGETRIVENYDDALTADGLAATTLGAAITENKPGSAIVDELCATVMLDQAYNTAGRLVLRPASFTARDRLLGVPAAREITDNDIIDGSWKEYAPKGDDRWGWGNTFTFDGVQPTATVAGWDGKPSQAFRGNPPSGQIVQRTVPIFAYRQDPRYVAGGASDPDEQAKWTLPYQREQAIVDFQVHYAAAVGLELGEFCYVTYYAAANANGTKGWNRKLCRVEGVTPSAEFGPVGITARVEPFTTPLLYDSYDRWTLFRPANFDTLTFNGTTSVTFNPSAATPDRVTSAWVGCIVKVAYSFNPKPYPAADMATYAPSSSIVFATKISAVVDQLHFTMANAAPASATVYAWRILYSHATPPPVSAFDATAAGQAGDTTPWTWYLQAADTTTGQFANGDAGQKFQGP